MYAGRYLKQRIFLRRVACTRSRSAALATLRSRTMTHLPAIAIRGCVAAIDAAPHAVDMTAGGV